MSKTLRTTWPNLSKTEKKDLKNNGIPPVCGIPSLFVSSASPQYWPNALNLFISMNEKFFYDNIRQTIFNGTLKQSQVDGINAILKACANGGIVDARRIAYILATAYH